MSHSQLIPDLDCQHPIHWLCPKCNLVCVKCHLVCAGRSISLHFILPINLQDGYYYLVLWVRKLGHSKLTWPASPSHEPSSQVRLCNSPTLFRGHHPSPRILPLHPNWFLISFLLPIYNPLSSQHQQWFYFWCKLDCVTSLLKCLQCFFIAFQVRTKFYIRACKAWCGLTPACLSDLTPCSITFLQVPATWPKFCFWAVPL